MPTDRPNTLPLGPSSLGMGAVQAKDEIITFFKQRLMAVD